MTTETHTRRRPRRLAPTLAGLLAGACLLTATGPVGAQALADGTTVVPMQGNRFLAPPEQVVPVGTTLTWTNRDGEVHDVVALDLSFSSPLVNPGEAWSFTFTAPGRYAYLCDLHAGMEGVVTVVSPDTAGGAPNLG